MNRNGNHFLSALWLMAAALLLLVGCRPATTGAETGARGGQSKASLEDFDYERAADIAAARWIAMGEYYAGLAEQKDALGALELTERHDVPYTGEQMLDIIAPEQAGPWPVVVMLHGLGADKSQYARGAEVIAGHGAVVFNANWRTEPWIHGEMALMEDTACAVRFARSNAAQFGGDPANVVLFGHSIAGWSSAVIALSGDDFAGDCLAQGVSALPDAFVSYAGAYDAGESNPDGGASFLKEENPALWEVIYPYAHIGSHPELRVRLLAGDQDPHFVAVAERFYAALSDAGYDVTLTVIEGLGHDGPAPGSNKFDLLVADILAAADDDS